MDFFEDLKKNVLDAADKTKKKTSELTALAKLTVSVKNEETKLAGCYKAIGRLFYTAERDNVDNTEEIATYIMQADKIKDTIEGYQKQIAVLRKVIVCESCNNQISNEAIFCPICGVKLPKPEPVVEEENCCCEEEAKEEACTSCCCEEEWEDAPAQEENCSCCENEDEETKAE